MTVTNRRRLMLAALATVGAVMAGCERNGTADTSVRLYVLDGGVLASDPARYQLTEADVGVTELAIAAYLIVHPQGILIWDTLAVADQERISDDVGVEQRLVRADMNERFVQLGPRLDSQLASIGYTPADVTHMALSHYHWDHTANSNMFASAAWLVRPEEREAMLAAPPPGGTRPGTFSALTDKSAILISDDEHDVFGDGSVILKSAPGHTEGHQVLYVKLVNTGGVLLSGDLYHYAAERRLGKVPVFEVDMEQTAAARADVEEFMARTDAQLWIGHDLRAHQRLKKVPQYYD